MKRLIPLVILVVSSIANGATGTITVGPEIEADVETTADGILLPVTNSFGDLVVEDTAYYYRGTFTGTDGYTISVSYRKSTGRAIVAYHGCTITLSPPDSFIVRDTYQITGRGDPLACTNLYETMLDFISFSDMEFGTKSKAQIDADPETANDEWTYFYSHPQGMWGCGAASVTAALGITAGAIITGYTVYMPLVPVQVKRYTVVGFVTGTAMAVTWAGGYCQ